MDIPSPRRQSIAADSTTVLKSMKTVAIFASLAVLVVSASAFLAPRPAVSFGRASQKVSSLNMGFMGDEEPKKLTRDSEPEDYFKTNTDKMTDEEKIPIAIAGFVFISLPFIAGLIALYAAK